MNCRRIFLFLTPLLLLLAGGASHAQAAILGDEQAERQALFQQRREIEARFAAQSQACKSRFGVNTCLADASHQRNASLKPVLAREDALDARQRQLRSAQQRERVAAKQRAFASEDGRRLTESLLDPVPASGPAAGTGSRPASAATVSAGAKAAAAARPSAQTQTQAQAQAEALRIKDLSAEPAAQRRAAERSARQLQIQQHQQEVLKRNQQRLEKGKPAAAALPIPSAADIAALNAANAALAASSGKR